MLGEEAFLDDVEDGGEEEDEGKEDEEFVGALPPPVLGEQLLGALDVTCHAAELILRVSHLLGRRN